jgi:hypothetical protein
VVEETLEGKAAEAAGPREALLLRWRRDTGQLSPTETKHKSIVADMRLKHLSALLTL